MSICDQPNKADLILENCLFTLGEGGKTWLATSEDMLSTVRNDSKDVLKMEVDDTLGFNETGCVKEEKSVLESLQSNVQFESVLEKNYTIDLRNDHIEDVENLFGESILNFEKQKLYQQIFNEILEKTNQRKLEELQKQYLEHLRGVSAIEVFKCSACSYETVNKLNLRSHLLLIHKSNLEFNTFQCLNCKYKSKSVSCLKKHLLSHSEAAIDTVLSDFDTADSPRNFTKRQTKKKKTSSRICDLCAFKSEDKESFEVHRKTHKTERGDKFKCHLCDFEKWSKMRLKKHLLTEHNIKPLGLDTLRILKCEFCDYTTEAKESFRVHSLSHKNPDEIQWFPCPECEFKTKFKRNLKNHVLLHNPEQIVKKYLCEVCSRSFRTRSKLTLHSLIHKNINEVLEIFHCDQCSYKTKNKYTLKQHMEVHKSSSELKTFVCDTCGFQSKRKWNYDAHLLTHKDENEVELHRCDVCGYSTKFKDRLTRHLKKGTHLSGKTSLKPAYYNCSACQFETVNRKTYYDHIQSHENPEEIAKGRFACDICGFRTKNKGGMDQHSLSHKRTGEVRSFKCPQPGCEFHTKFRGSLAAHIDRHKDPSQVTIYKCDVCGLQSRSKWNHNMHLITHKSSTEVEIFNCSICSYQTKFKAYLKAHLKKRHNIVTTRVRVKT